AILFRRGCLRGRRGRTRRGEKYFPVAIADFARRRFEAARAKRMKQRHRLEGREKPQALPRRKLRNRLHDDAERFAAVPQDGSNVEVVVRGTHWKLPINS